MPVLVNPKQCINRDSCFAAAACPKDAYIHNTLKRTWEVDATICGDCPGPCLNFCDQDALRWGDDLVDLQLVKDELEGTMTHDQVLEARVKHKTELAEAAKKKSTDGIVDLTAANFEQEAIRADLPVVIDCWADWCAPCKQFSPVFEATSKQYAGVVKFAKLDTDAEPALARGLGIEALPTVLMLYKGQIVNEARGAMPSQHFNAWLYQTLAAVRQYESQLAAEAESAIGAASQRVGTMNTAGEQPDDAPQPGQPATQQPAPPASPGLVLDGALDAPPRSGGPNAGRKPDAPGKRTSSGLYIP